MKAIQPITWCIRCGYGLLRCICQKKQETKP